MRASVCRFKIKWNITSLEIDSSATRTGYIFICSRNPFETGLEKTFGSQPNALPASPIFKTVTRRVPISFFQILIKSAVSFMSPWCRTLCVHWIVQASPCKQCQTDITAASQPFSLSEFTASWVFRKEWEQQQHWDPNPNLNPPMSSKLFVYFPILSDHQRLCASLMYAAVSTDINSCLKFHKIHKQDNTFTTHVSYQNVTPTKCWIIQTNKKCLLIRNPIRCCFLIHQRRAINGWKS